LVSLAEISDEQKSLSQDQNQKLNLVFDLIEVITGSSKQKSVELKNDAKDARG
jgi:hypothetical protein